MVENPELRMQQESRAKLCSMSGAAYTATGRYWDWYKKLEEYVKNNDLRVGAGPKGHYQRIYMPVEVPGFGKEPTIGEFEYVSDFNKGHGEVILAWFTAYKYNEDGSWEHQTFSTTEQGGSTYIVVTNKTRVEADGSKIVQRKEGGTWVVERYDTKGNLISEPKM